MAYQAGQNWVICAHYGHHLMFATSRKYSAIWHCDSFGRRPDSLLSVMDIVLMA
jgi:hypothetical protein